MGLLYRSCFNGTHAKRRSSSSTRVQHARGGKENTVLVIIYFCVLPVYYYSLGAKPKRERPKLASIFPKDEADQATSTKSAEPEESKATAEAADKAEAAPTRQAKTARDRRTRGGEHVGQKKRSSIRKVDPSQFFELRRQNSAEPKTLAADGK